MRDIKGQVNILTVAQTTGLQTALDACARMQQIQVQGFQNIAGEIKDANTRITGVQTDCIKMKDDLNKYHKGGEDNMEKLKEDIKDMGYVNLQL